jgi:hypothetical protein
VRRSLKTKKEKLWNSKTKRKTKSSLTSSKTQQVTRVAIRVIVQDAHHVHVFINHVPTTHREDSIVIRIKTRVDSALRALAQVYRVQLLSVVVIVLVTTITARVAISLVLVSSMDSPKENMVSHAVAISPVPVLSMVSRVVISPVPVTISLRKVREVMLHSAVVISPVSREVMVVLSRVVMVVLSRVATVVHNRVAMVVPSREVMANLTEQLLIRRAHVSIPQATIPMLSIA